MRASGAWLWDCYGVPSLVDLCLPLCVCARACVRTHVFHLAHSFVNTLDLPQFYGYSRNWGLFEMLAESLRFWPLTQVWQGFCLPSDCSCLALILVEVS